MPRSDSPNSAVVGRTTLATGEGGTGAAPVFAAGVFALGLRHHSQGELTYSRLIQSVRITRSGGSASVRDWSSASRRLVTTQTSWPRSCRYSASLPTRTAPISFIGGKNQERIKNPMRYFSARLGGGKAFTP